MDIAILTIQYIRTYLFISKPVRAHSLREIVPFQNIIGRQYRSQHLVARIEGVLHCDLILGFFFQEIIVQGTCAQQADSTQEEYFV